MNFKFEVLVSPYINWPTPAVFYLIRNLSTESKDVPDTESQPFDFSILMKNNRG